MEDIISFEALYESMQKCKRGVIWKDSVAHFVLNAVEEINKLHSQLEDGTYKTRKTKVFIVDGAHKREAMVFYRGITANTAQKGMSYNAISKVIIRICDTTL